MSRSENQTRCGRGCSVCGIGELDNEQYRLAREAELDEAAAVETEIYLEWRYCRDDDGYEWCDEEPVCNDTGPLKVPFIDVMKIV